MTRHINKKHAALAAGLALAAGCKDSPVVAPVNSPTVEQASGALTKSGLQTLALGVIAADRAAIGGSATYSYLVIPEIYARDAYRIDASESRYVTETLGGTPDPGGFSGSGGWTFIYTAIRAANSLIAALPNALPEQISETDKSAAAGFANTIKALDYYREIELRDTVGIAIQPADPKVIDPADIPIVCKESALNYTAALLDSALTNLQAAGEDATFPFSLPSGFHLGATDYQEVANFIKFNRGLKGKVDVYRGLDHAAPDPAAFTAAIEELTTALDGAAPGAVPASSFDDGPYVTFVAGGTENTPNPIADSKIGLNPQVQDSILPGDARSAKIVSRSTLSGNGLATDITYVGASTAVATNASRPLGILRVEEMVLLRAQAYFESGNFAAGTADLNSVHTAYGLAPYPVFSDIGAARSALLYDKRYSLLFEGPQRLVDLRAYGLLKAPYQAPAFDNDPYNTAYPIPKPEVDARGGTVSLSCS